MKKPIHLFFLFLLLIILVAGCTAKMTTTDINQANIPIKNNGVVEPDLLENKAEKSTISPNIQVSPGKEVLGIGEKPGEKNILPDENILEKQVGKNVEIKAGKKADNREEKVEDSAEIERKNEDVTPVDKEIERTVTLFISAATILDNIDEFNADKLSILPADGLISPTGTIVLLPDETAFDVLLRTMKEHKIHLEFTGSAVYNSRYIEGIQNIYEFDCGNLSGWMYTINGEFPGFGMSQYKLTNGDAIALLYTCDLGRDIGGFVEE